MVASHTEKPLGFSNQRSLFAPARESKWLERCRLPKGRLYSNGGDSFPAIYFPSLARTVTVGSQPQEGQLYGWLPLSNAYGISSGATRSIHNGYRHFFRCNTNQYITAIGISSGAIYPTHNGYRHFIRYITNQYITAIGIYSAAIQTKNNGLTAFHSIHHNTNITAIGIYSAATQPQHNI